MFPVKFRSLRKAPPFPKVFISGLSASGYRFQMAMGQKWWRCGKADSDEFEWLEWGQARNAPENSLLIISSEFHLLELLLLMLGQGRGYYLGEKRRKKTEEEKILPFHGNISRKPIDSCVSACFFSTVFFNRPKENFYEVICMWIMFIEGVLHVSHYGQLYK